MIAGAEPAKTVTLRDSPRDGVGWKALPGLCLVGALWLGGCGNGPSPPVEKAAAPPSPPAASGESLSRPPAAAAPAPPAPLEDRRQRREERVGQRLRAAEAAGVVEVVEAQRRHAHGAVVEFDGRVQKLLREDRKGLQHQRFLVAVEGAGTLLIAHNIGLAGRVPAAVGDVVRVRGIFEWNPKGGVVHWTHHDPRGRTAGGWIRLGGNTYR